MLPNVGVMWRCVIVFVFGGQCRLVGNSWVLQTRMFFFLGYLVACGLALDLFEPKLFSYSTDGCFIRFPICFAEQSWSPVHVVRSHDLFSVPSYTKPGGARRSRKCCCHDVGGSLPDYSPIRHSMTEEKFICFLRFVVSWGRIYFLIIRSALQGSIWCDFSLALRENDSFLDAVWHDILREATVFFSCRRRRPPKQKKGCCTPGRPPYMVIRGECCAIFCGSILSRKKRQKTSGNAVHCLLICGSKRQSFVWVSFVWVAMVVA